MSKSLMNSLVCLLHRNWHFDHLKEPTLSSLAIENEITFILASIISILNKNEQKNVIVFPRYGRHIQTHIYVSQAQIQIVEAWTPE